MDGERRRHWQEIAAFDQIKSCWCRTVPQAGYMCDKCQRIFISGLPEYDGKQVAAQIGDYQDYVKWWT